MSERTFGPADVCLAAGLKRETLHMWVARKCLPLPPGPGMGRERQFTFDEALLVATTADIAKLGLTVSAAVAAALRVIQRAQADASTYQTYAIMDGGVVTMRREHDCSLLWPAIVVDMAEIRRRTKSRLGVEEIVG